MHNVPPPTLNDELVLDAITAAKHISTRSALESVRNQILNAYQSYAAAAPALEGLVVLTLKAHERKALLHAYEVGTKPMTALRGTLLQHPAATRCPFCGVNASATLDHYLPKEVHPVFSIYSRNLVPCCGHCNILKSGRIVDKVTKVRMFLHPYFDVIPAQRYLHLGITVSKTGIALSYRVKCPSGVPALSFLQIKSHFQVLGLADRYRRMSFDELRGRHGALLRLYGTARDSSRVRAELASESDSQATAHGVNHWRAVLYATLADSTAFCDGGFLAMDKVKP